MDRAPASARALTQAAVLQPAGHAPLFGIVSAVTGKSLTFDCGELPARAVARGLAAQFDFTIARQHHQLGARVLSVAGKRLVASADDVRSTALKALLSLGPQDAASSAASREQQRLQRACHARFTAGMGAVVESFYQLLPIALNARLDQALSTAQRSELAGLQTLLQNARGEFARLFTEAYPLYQAVGARPDADSSGETLELVDADKLDDVIRRSTVAKRVLDALDQLPEKFGRHYGQVFVAGEGQAANPYHPEAVMDCYAALLDPLPLSVSVRALCYAVMGQALEQAGLQLYRGLLELVSHIPVPAAPKSSETPDLMKWLAGAGEAGPASRAQAGAAGGGGSPGGLPNAASGGGSFGGAQAAAPFPVLGDAADGFALPGQAPADTSHWIQDALHAEPPALAEQAASAPAPSLLARERILANFVPSSLHGASEAGHPGATHLVALDDAALQALSALVQRPPSIDAGSEKLSPASQVRGLMVQAQGLLLQLTLDGLTYQSNPRHAAWQLINALEALHEGADDRGCFLDQSVHQFVSRCVKWLLEQGKIDAALEQVVGLLAKIDARLHADRLARREKIIRDLGSIADDPGVIDHRWCVLRRADEAIPYEVLGTRVGQWLLLNRSATDLLEIPHARFVEDLDSGRIVPAESYDEPFLTRTANATLTASLDAIFTYTRLDSGSSLLNRYALMDEIERQLDHPVIDPPQFCALVELPLMRASEPALKPDELSGLRRRAGELLQATLEAGEHCGRLSDIGFLLLFAPQHPGRVAERLDRLAVDMARLHPMWRMHGAVVPLLEEGASATTSDVLRRANQACAPQRAAGRFDRDRLADAARDYETRHAGEGDMPLPFDSLYLRCQRISRCADGVLSHCEVLLGLEADLAARHTPQSLVLLAEQSDRINELDLWVLRSTLDWMDRHAADLEKLSGLSVNLSGASITDPAHLDAIVELIGSCPQHREKLIFEVTETAAIGNMETAVLAIQRLRRVGCRIALDDFGSGYSSYAYLRRLPLDYLKIDGTYVRNVLMDKTDQALTASMVDVAHALGLKAIAEFVESEEVHRWLTEVGVDFMQGYYVHEPERLESLFDT